MPAERQKKVAAPARRKASKRPPTKTPPAKSPRPKAAKGTRRVGRTAAVPAVAAGPSLTEMPVLVVGDHPAASFCALLLKEAKIDVALVDIGSTPGGDRLVTINPAFFKLHKSLESLRSKLDLTAVTYARFLGPNGEEAHSRPSPSVSKKPGNEALAYIGSMLEVRQAMRQLALDAGVPRVEAKLEAEAVDERGAHVLVNGEHLVPRILAVADPLSDESGAILEIPRFPGRGSSVQATARLAGSDGLFGAGADEEAIVLSLDLGRRLQWGWLLRRRDEAQLCVQCPPEGDVPALMEEWTQILRRQGVLAPDVQPDLASLRVADLPLGGALMRDVVARRTLLFGPAGGFYSASGEDVYPACWSAKYAAEIAAKAVKADHPQDALGAYRGRWGSTLGDYLRGPQQNLRFLLPLVYKNPVMTDRLVEAILLGRSLVK